HTRSFSYVGVVGAPEGSDRGPPALGRRHDAVMEAIAVTLRGRLIPTAVDGRVDGAAEPADDIEHLLVAVLAVFGDEDAGIGPHIRIAAGHVRLAFDREHHAEARRIDFVDDPFHVRLGLVRPFGERGLQAEPPPAHFADPRGAGIVRRAAVVDRPARDVDPDVVRPPLV